MAKGLSIKDESISFEELFEFQAIPPEERATMAKAQVLLIPSGYRDSPHAFSSGTSEFLAYCREKMPGIVDICTTDEGYVEIELNSCTLRINKIVVMEAVFTVFLGVLSNYITDWSKNYLTPQEPKVECIAPPTVSFSINVIDSVKGMSKRFDYEGSAEDAPEIIKEIETLWNGQERNPKSDK